MRATPAIMLSQKSHGSLTLLLRYEGLKGLKPVAPAEIRPSRSRVGFVSHFRQRRASRHDRHQLRRGSTGTTRHVGPPTPNAASCRYIVRTLPRFQHSTSGTRLAIAKSKDKEKS